MEPKANYELPVSPNTKVSSDNSNTTAPTWGDQSELTNDQSCSSRRRLWLPTTKNGRGVYLSLKKAEEFGDLIFERRKVNKLNKKLSIGEQGDWNKEDIFLQVAQQWELSSHEGEYNESTMMKINSYSICSSSSSGSSSNGSSSSSSGSSSSSSASNSSSSSSESGSSGSNSSSSGSSSSGSSSNSSSEIISKKDATPPKNPEEASKKADFIDDDDFTYSMEIFDVNDCNAVQEYKGESEVLYEYDDTNDSNNNESKKESEEESANEDSKYESESDNTSSYNSDNTDDNNSVNWNQDTNMLS